MVDLEHEHESIATFWENNFGYSVDYGIAGLNCIQKFKGYSFVSVIYDSPVEDRIALLDKAMAEAEPGKPVFFVQHEMPAKTLYITENGNSDDMEIGHFLKNPKYNNVVFIGAHSHNPLTDERAIWQGDFTLFTPCSLFGPTVEGQNYYSNGNEKGSFQPDWNKYKQGIVAKLFDDKMVLERWDYVKNEKLGVDWVVDINDGNIDLSKYNYNNRYQTAVAPIYQSGAKITVSPISETMEQISFPSCTYTYEGKDDIVVQYEVEVLKGSEVVQAKHLCSSHYKGRGYENGLTYTVEVGNLKPGIEYTVNVYAMESYKKKSNPLTAIFKTSNNAQENVDKPRFDYNVVNDMDSNFSSFSNIGQGFYKRDNYLEGNEYSSAKLVSNDKLEGNGAVEAVISIANPHKSLNAGLYVFASDAGKGQDEINAWNIELESAVDSKDLTVNLYRFENLTYKNCPCGTKILNYFDDGASKGNVLVRAIISGNYLTVTIDGNEVFTYKVGSMKDGQVGIRSFYSDSRINALRIFDYHYSPAGNNLDAYLSRARDMLAYRVSENGLDVNDGELWINKDTHDYLQEVYDKYSSSEYSYAENKIHEAETALTIALNFVSQSAKFGQKGMFENKKTMLDAYMEKIDILMSYQISTDGQDVYTNMKWINQATYDALKATKEEYSKSEHRVSIESLDNAINKVKEAICVAEATVKQGLKQKEEEKKTTDQTPLVVVGFVVAGVFFIAFVLMLVLFLHSRKPKAI